MSTNVPQTQCLPFVMCIALGVASVLVTSMGISNAKKKGGGTYYLQVIGLIAAIAWTIVFLWKLAQATGALKQGQAIAAGAFSRMRGGSTNASLSGATASS